MGKSLKTFFRTLLPFSFIHFSVSRSKSVFLDKTHLSLSLVLCPNLLHPPPTASHAQQLRPLSTATDAQSRHHHQLRHTPKVSLLLYHRQSLQAQYFVWFFCLLPLMPWCNMKLKWEGLCCIFLWVGAQTHWLMWGYLLEFKGKNVFLQRWAASLVFLAANTFVLFMIIRHHRLLSPVFEHASSKNAVKLE